MPDSEAADKTDVHREWEHADLECRVTIVRENHYCGYVCVPEAIRDDLRYTSTYDEKLGVLEADVDVHGGVTYGLDGDGWIGFDTAHAGDTNYDGDGEPLPGWPNMMQVGRGGGDLDTDWTPETVTAEAESLADQLATHLEGSGDV